MIQNVYDLVTLIMHDPLKNAKKQFYTDEYPLMFSKYPVILKKAFESDFDFDLFSEMWQKSLSTDIESETKQMGQKLFNKYVKLPPPNFEQIINK